MAGSESIPVGRQGRSRTVTLYQLAALIVMGLAAIAVAMGWWRADDEAAALGQTISLAELPSGVGRGFPLASMAGIENQHTGLERGELAPDFRLTLDDGRTLTLHDLRGRPVMLNFWATWCGPCRLEMPEIVARAGADNHLVVLAINVQEEIEPIEAFAQEFQMHLPVVQDRSGELRKLYQVHGMPTSVFIDRNGAITDVWTGLLTADTLDRLLANNS